MVARQAHNLEAAGSNPAPATSSNLDDCQAPIIKATLHCSDIHRPAYPTPHAYNRQFNMNRIDTETQYPAGIADKYNEAVAVCVRALSTFTEQWDHMDAIAQFQLAIKQATDSGRLTPDDIGTI